MVKAAISPSKRSRGTEFDSTMQTCSTVSTAKKYRLLESCDPKIYLRLCCVVVEIINSM